MAKDFVSGQGAKDLYTWDSYTDGSHKKLSNFILPVVAMQPPTKSLDH